MFLLSLTHGSPLIWLGWTASHTTNNIVFVCAEMQLETHTSLLRTRSVVLVFLKNESFSGAAFHSFNGYVFCNM